MIDDVSMIEVGRPHSNVIDLTHDLPERLAATPGHLYVATDDVFTQPLPGAILIPPGQHVEVPLAPHPFLDRFEGSTRRRLAGRSGLTQAGADIDFGDNGNDTSHARIINKSAVPMTAPHGARFAVGATFVTSATPIQGEELHSFADRIVMLEDGKDNRPFVVESGQFKQQFGGIALPVEYIFRRRPQNGQVHPFDLSKAPRGTQRLELYKAIGLDPNPTPLNEAVHSDMSGTTISSTAPLQLPLGYALVIEHGIWIDAEGSYHYVSHHNSPLLKSESASGTHYKHPLKFETSGAPRLVVASLFKMRYVREAVQNEEHAMT